MATQHSESIAARIKEMELRPENANREWVFGWFTTAKNKRDADSKEITIKEMQIAWAYFRSYCKRNGLEIQGYRRITLSKKHDHPKLEIGIFAAKESLERINEALAGHFTDHGFKSVTKKAKEQCHVDQYIEKYFSKSHTPEQQDQLRNTVGTRPTVFINPPIQLKQSLLMMQ
ncbi:hypothetical protein HGG82_08110 [Marinomonas sp. M1K-6]|uniref:Uncharacterized protein n=1 Tax=Marinomonas profundi TaxID=2726122 RepID=A0A847R1H2_9GAMM|nr:hypothetical protein [Marinomonas profundi]NLQ17591.1 hypothetical protein [Marinomonas profundi]UDV02192.1 hypothetical protein J8N69_11370 [Marinomonas profundi]